MPITRTDVVAHMERGMRAGFLRGMKTYKPRRSAFVRETSSDGAFEVYADMGATPWPVHNGGQSGPQGTDGRTGAQQVGGLTDRGPITILGGHERALTVYNRDWDVAIGISHNAIEDGSVANLENWARSAGSNYQKHMDYLCFQALNDGESTTSQFGLAYDGLSFFSDSHVEPGGTYTTAQDNKLATAISNANFNAAYIAGSKFLDGRGNYAGFEHNLLIHAVDLRDEAAQITDNPLKDGTPNNDVNVNQGLIMRLAAPGGWLDTTAWYVVDTSGVERPINLQIRKQPSLVQWDDENLSVRYYKWVSRYEVFYGDWRTAVQGNT